MQKIIAVIKQNDAGEAVANLQDALFAMLEHGYISPMPPGEHPSEKDLQKLREKLKDERSKSLFGEATTQLVFYFQLQNGLGDNLRGLMVDKKTAEKLNEFLNAHGLLDWSDTYIVRGIVTDQSNQPVKALTIKAFDRDLRTAQLLGEAVTDDSGSYKIEYQASTFSKAENADAAPDLMVTVADQSQNVLAESDIRFNASRDEVFDFTVVAKVISEWERISKAVLPLLENQKEDREPLPPNELTSTDLDFIVADTRLDREQLRLWALAFSVAMEAISLGRNEVGTMSSIGTHANRPANTPDKAAAYIALYYGWFRDGNPQNLNGLLKVPTDRLISSLENAIKQNFIPDIDKKQFGAIETFINQLKVKHAIKPAAKGEPASLGAILNTMNADWVKDKLDRVVNLTSSTSHKSEDFLEQAESAGLDNTQALQLRQTLYLGDVTQKNIPLMKVLQPMVADDKQGSLKGLASLTSGDWLNLAYEHGAESPGLVSLAGYAENLQTAVENLVPHEILKTKLDTDSITFLPPNFANVKTVLAKYKDFDIANSNIDQFAEDNKIDPKTTSALAKLQHLKRLNASWDEVSILVNTNIDNAEKITNYGKDQFKGILKNHLPEDRLDEIYRHASTLKAASIGLMGHMFPVLYGVSPAVMADKSLKSHKAQIDSNPTLRKIFGALDNCACDPCLSVLSPAAYLADLLKIIDGSPDMRAELERRRSDIFDLELSCDNTKIELPQIDLAIEILENAIALPFEVVLPSHTDMKSELSDGKPVGNNVFQALQETSKEKLSNLIAKDNSIHSNALSNPGKVNWIVKDQYRTWSIESFEETLAFKKLAQTIPLDIKKIVNNGPVAELNSGNIPVGLESDVETILGDVIGLKLPLGQSDIDKLEIILLDPTSKNNLKKWKINFSLEGEIYIDPQDNLLTISRLDGLDYTKKDVAPKLLAEFKTDLDNNQITSIFIGYLNNVTRTKKYKINEFSITQKDVNLWGFIYTGSINLEYQPAKINITGLAYQSTAANRDLFVKPQNINPLAYKAIAAEDACFPWSLPYNQALNETRETLNAAGITRLSLLESITPYEKRYSSIEIAKERLGLSTAELALITTSQLKTNNEANDKLLKIWGLKAVRTAQTIKDTFSDEVLEKPAFGDEGLLTRVSILLQQSGLSFAEFDRLLECEYINPGALISITESSGENCRPFEMRLNKTNESELAPFLDRLHRFVRLWRVVDWQIWELDLALQAEGIGNNNPDDTAVIQIANLKVLQNRLHLPIDVLVAMIAGFSNKRYKQPVRNEIREVTPIYDRLFQNRQLIDPPNPQLAFSASLSVIDESLTELIAASVGLRKSDLTFILDSYVIDLPRTILNGAQIAKNELLQQVFRNVTLAKALGLSLHDYESAWQLLPSNHFETPATLLGFLNEQDFVKNSGFDWGELGYLLLDSTLNPNVAALELTAERANQIFSALQGELRQLISPESEALMLEQRADSVVKHLALATSLEPSLARGLLESCLHSEETTSESAMQYFTSDLFINVEDINNSSAFVILERLYKVALLNNKWKSGLSEFAWTTAGMAQTEDVFAGLVFNTLQPVETTTQEELNNWKQSTALFRLAHSSPEMSSLITSYVSTYQATVIADEKASDALSILATSFGLSKATVEACVDKLGMAGDQYLNPLCFVNLISLLEIVHQLGVDGAGLAVLVTEVAFDASAELAGKLLKSRFGDSGWEKALRKINDALRLQRRDRLVDFLLARESLYDSNALFKHYLIDFEMSPCMNTTRILQSTAAVQLFVQRCLFNLEQPEVTPDEIVKKRWEWTQNYRVWEANRKVFLCPENWLFPEVRDDKTEAFKAFENALTQNEPSHVNAVASLKQYLDDLVEIGQISVVAMYNHEEKDAQKLRNTLYLFGRVPNEAHSLYWCKSTNYGTPSENWAGWARVDAEVNSEYVIPFVYEGDLIIAWPNIKTYKESGNELDEFFEISMNWAKKTSRGWLKHKTSPTKLPATIEKPVDKTIKESFAFLLNEVESQSSAQGLPQSVRIDIYALTPKSAPTPWNPLPSSASLVPAISNNSSKVFWTLDFLVQGCNVTYMKPEVHGYAIQRNQYQLMIAGLKKETLADTIGISAGGGGRLDLVGKIFDDINKIIDDFAKTLNQTDAAALTALVFAQKAAIVLALLNPFVAYVLIIALPNIIGAAFPNLAKLIADYLNAPVYRVTGDLNDWHYLNQDEIAAPTDRMISYEQGNESKQISIKAIGFDEEEPIPFSNGINLPNGVEAGKALRVDLNILFTLGKDNQYKKPAVPLHMKSVGSFRFQSGIDDNWEAARLINNQAQVIYPLRSTTFLANGYQENGPGICGFLSPSYPEKMWVLPAQQPYTESALETWYVEEGINKLIIRTEERAFVNQLHPISYTESLQYKTLESVSLGSLFDYPIATKAGHVWFGAESISRWISTRRFVNDPRDNPDLGFDLRNPNSNYNWEVFYHLPIAAAVHLSRQHRFEDARQWFHFIFDPTTTDSVHGTQRFWRFLPFRSSQEPSSITELLEALAGKSASNNLGQSAKNQVAAWLESPFNPFAVARLRTSAFEWYTVISYIKNLTEWADQLFRRDTRESINEATLLYIMAAEILGPRPEKIRACKGINLPMSYKELIAQKGGLDEFSNVWLSLSDTPLVKAWIEFLKWLAQHGINPTSAWEQLSQLSSIGSSYFNVPPNEKLPELWDTVDDRLFKIRNCQNIEGVRRSLSLYEPPIDPELLIRAKAAGLDLSEVLADRFAPLPHYRFQVLLQKANEFCNEVKGLGGSILSATEKKEAEHLALLRSSQEIDMLKLVESVKQEQIKEAEANIDALNKTRNNALDRFVFLQRQLGKTELTFDANGSPIVEQSLITSVQETGTPDDARSLSLINNEVDQLLKMQAAHDFAMISSILKIAGGVAHTVGAVAEPTGTTYRVANAIGNGLSTAADGISMISSINSYLERRSSIIGSWQRRRDEWVQQSKMTSEEIRQIDKQIVALEIRKSIAEKELDNHRKQIENAQNIDDYMRQMKFSSESLYGWMESQISGLYFSAYQMAYDLAKKAERAYQFELGEPTSNFVRYGHWDSLRKGLLSGERLSQNLRRMETAYLERNKRELEITKHISLRQLDPLALMQLRDSGQCEFDIPEVLFDLDFPGHFFRRIKSVSISIPCVVGPYTSVSGTLTLLSSKLRVKPDYTNDESLQASHLPTQSIATSSGQNDSGMFELNFRDERYLPFEGAGIISSWALKLPKDYRPFDYDTISDVILHVRYTTRDAGVEFGRIVNEKIQENLNSLKAYSEQNDGLWQLIDLKNEYPKEWQKYRMSDSKDPAEELEINVGCFPFILKNKNFDFEEARIISKDTKEKNLNRAVNGYKITLQQQDFNQSHGCLALRYTIKDIP